MTNEGKKRIKVCPQCGSSDIFYENAMITGAKYHCKACDYIGALVLERYADEAGENSKAD